MTRSAPPLSPAGRAHALAAMAAQELDVLVIGGGVTGAGCALDAVTRGLTVGLVEARDFAAGTSSRSTKLFHGGLRYLEQLNFPLVLEALKERSLVLNTLCPHLARPVPFIYPLERPVLDRAYVGLGIGVYDVMGAGRGVPGHQPGPARRGLCGVDQGGPAHPGLGGRLVSVHPARRTVVTDPGDAAAPHPQHPLQHPDHLEHRP